MLVGGYAVGIHGYVRATTDIGFYYCSTADNIERLMRAMTVFGAPAALMATFPQRPNPLPHRRGNRCVVADEASRST